MPDAEGRPTDAHELNQQLANTIGSAVEQLLGMSNYSEANNSAIDAALAARGNTTGQPGGGSTQEQPNASGQPAAAGVTPSTQQPTAHPAPVQENLDAVLEQSKVNGKYFGKWDTKAEAVKGYFNVVNMSKNAFTQRDEVARENASLKEALEALRRQPTVTPAVVPQDSTVTDPPRGKATVPGPKLDKVLSKLQENGNLDAEDLTNLVSAISEHSREVAAQVAQEVYETRTSAVSKEAARWAKVEAFMAEKYPEAANFTGELELFVKSHPLIGAGVQALIAQDRHEEATAAAWEAYVLQSGKQPGFVPAPATRENVEKEIRLDAADQVRREAVDAARRDAGVIPSIAGGGARGVHENVNAGPGQDEYDDAVARMRQGDGTKWRALVFGDSLNHPILNG